MPHVAVREIKVHIAATPRATLRSSERDWRAAPLAVPVTYPAVPDFLADVAEGFANSAQPLVESPVFVLVGLVIAAGLLWARVQGLV